jgi:hypothetical protein
MIARVTALASCALFGCADAPPRPPAARPAARTLVAPVETPPAAPPVEEAGEPEETPAEPTIDPVVGWLAQHPEARFFVFASARAEGRSLVAGAVEDPTGVTACLLEIGAGECRCFREEGAVLVAGRDAVITIDVEPALEVGLVIDGSERLRIYRRAADGATESAFGARATTPAISPASAAIAEPPWPRTVVADNRARTENARRARARSSPATPIAEPAWTALLRDNPDLASHELFRSQADLFVRITVRAERTDDGTPARNHLLVRRDASWSVSPAMERAIDAALPSSALRPSTVAVLVRNESVSPVASTSVPYTDYSGLQLFVVDGPRLRSIAEMLLGERGFVRTLEASHTWRIFHRVEIAGPGCIVVTRDHAFSASFDRTSGRFGPELPFAPVGEGDGVDPVAQYNGVAGRYLLGESGFTRGTCP